MKATFTFNLTPGQKQLLLDVAREDRRTSGEMLRLFTQDCLPAYRAKLKAARDTFKSVPNQQTKNHL